MTEPTNDVVCGWRILVAAFDFIELFDFIGTSCWSAVLEADKLMRSNHHIHKDVPVWIKEVRPIHGGGITGNIITCYDIPLDEMGRPEKEGIV